MNVAVTDISQAGQTAALASFAARLRFADLPADVDRESENLLPRRARLLPVRRHPAVDARC